jgi:hypothetical protein
MSNQCRHAKLLDRASVIKKCDSQHTNALGKGRNGTRHFKNRIKRNYSLSKQKQSRMANGLKRKEEHSCWVCRRVACSLSAFIIVYEQRYCSVEKMKKKNRR